MNTLKQLLVITKDKAQLKAFVISWGFAVLSVLTSAGLLTYIVLFRGI